MSDDDYTKESVLSCVRGDYVNEVIATHGRIENTLRREGVHHERGEDVRDFFARVGDQKILEIFLNGRAKRKVRTLEERFLDPASKQSFPDGSDRHALIDWMKNSPLRVKRINELVEILNTSDDIQQIKMAINEMYRVIDYTYNHGLYKIFHVSEKTPTNPMRTIPANSPPTNKP